MSKTEGKSREQEDEDNRHRITPGQHTKSEPRRLQKPNIQKKIKGSGQPEKTKIMEKKEKKRN